jgi:hypothetical protein
VFELVIVRTIVLIGIISGCGQVWLSRLVWSQEIGGSIPLTLTGYISECGLKASRLIWDQDIE